MAEVKDNWHSKVKEEIFSELKTSEKGLTDEQYKRILAEKGLNEISEKKKTPPIFKFLKQFNSPLIYILIVAAAISFFIKHLVDAFVILFVVIINAIIGFV
ncbi:MAG: cation transporter, partial [Nanoarchaeota archaeon]|nr:cation transporter [Nanoarchaeota archaeon]